MGSRRAGALVTLLVLGSAAIRFAGARSLEPGWIAPDEAIYTLLGRSLWETGSASVLGTGGYNALLYPALVGLPLRLGELETGLVVVQALQALAMSATAALVYLWGRRSMGAGWALVAAGLTVAIPGLAYTGLVMTEALLYPLVTAALWSLAAALERPTLRRQAVLLAALAATVAAHVQMLALVPAIVLAVALVCVFERSPRTARRFAPLFAALAAVVVAALGLTALRGNWRDAFGAYAAAIGGYEPGAAAADVAWHAGAVFLLVAGVPLVALGLLAVECVRRREGGTAAGALVATAVAWTVCLTVEVGVFASQWVGHLAERDLLTVAPPLFLVFGLWLARGVPRPRYWAQGAALALAAPAILLPIGRFAVQEAALDAFGLVPLWRFAEATSEATLELAFPLVAGLLTAAALLVPARARNALPVLVALVLVPLSVVSARELSTLTELDRAWVFETGDPRWVDAAADGPVTYLHTRSAYPAGVWKHLFWNRSISAVATMPGAVPLAPLAPAVVETRPDGVLAGADASGLDPGLDAGLVVAPTFLELDGELLATAPVSTDLPGLALWRTRTPVRVVTERVGFEPNGDVFSEAAVTVYGCERDGRLELTLLGKDDTTVVLHANGIPLEQVRIRPETVWQGSVAAPPDADGSGPCLFTLTTGGLVGTTVIEWIPG